MKTLGKVLIGTFMLSALGCQLEKLPPLPEAKITITTGEADRVAGKLIRLSGSASNNAVSYVWNFGEDPEETVSGVNPTYTYDAPGNYSITLTATSAEGNQDIDSTTIEIKPAPLSAPRALFVINRTDPCFAPCTISFTNISSGGSGNTYSWEFGNGQSSNEVSPSVVYQSAGEFTIRLTATNSVGVNSKDTTITILAPTTKPEAKFSVNRTTCFAPCTITISNNSTGEGNTYEWEFGDGDTSSTSAISFPYEYENPGSYNIRLRAINSAGSDDAEPVTINVSPTTYSLQTLDWNSEQEGVTEREYSVRAKIGSNNPDVTLSGIRVLFEVESGGGKINGGNSDLILSNSSGEVTGTWRLGDELFTENRISLSIDDPSIDTSPINFVLTPHKFQDTRPNGRAYSAVRIGNQIWMAENLNHGVMTEYPSNNNIIEKYCYDNLEENCEQGQVFYDFLEAMNYDTDNLENYQGICPEGWVIPSDEDWQALEFAIGMSVSEIGTVSGTRPQEFRGNAADKLKNSDACITVNSNCNMTGFNAKMDGVLISAYLGGNCGADCAYFNGGEEVKYHVTSWSLRRMFRKDKSGIFRGWPSDWGQQPACLRCVKKL